MPATSRGAATPEQRSGDAFADTGEGAAADAGKGADLGGGGGGGRRMETGEEGVGEGRGGSDGNDGSTDDLPSSEAGRSGVRRRVAQIGRAHV